MTRRAKRTSSLKDATVTITVNQEAAPAKAKPKSASRRTFTACWTCRGRNVRCDRATPHCGQCTRRGAVCEGYAIRLVWVDSETGHYEPQHRRAFPCELTWSGYPPWTLTDVNRLIEDCGEGGAGRTGARNPFRVFSHGDPCMHQPGDHRGHLHVPIDRRESRTRPGVPNTPTTMDPENSSSGGEGHDRPTANVSERNSRAIDRTETLPVTNSPPATDGILSVANTCTRRILDISSDSSSNEQDEQEVSLFRGPVSGRSPTAHVPLLISPRQSWTATTDGTENWLFHHYLTSVSLIYIPIDGSGNPWKSTYPSMAVQNTSSVSSRSLYHAILAQSALNMANLRGRVHGADDKSRGLQYFGRALQELQQSLSLPTEDYSSVLAALLTITFVQDVFLGGTPGWRRHFRGASDFVNQYLHQEPWLQSFDAWVITQNFALSAVISQTASSCDANDRLEGGRDASINNIAHIGYVLSNVMRRSNFGYTIGGTARIISSIYEIRLLEQEMARCNLLEHNVTSRVNTILERLDEPTDEEVQVFCEQEPEPGSAVRSADHMRSLARLHLRLFSGGAKIYLYSVVLRRRPSSVVQYVWQVLSDTVAFIDLHGTSVSVWPVFMAACEAHTSAAQGLVERFLDFADGLGTKNRTDIQRVIRQVWHEREQLAITRECGQGEVWVDWRDVIARLELDILLL